MTENGVQGVISVLLFLAATGSCHFGLGLAIWLSAVIGLVCAFFGLLFLVIVFDGDGDLW